VRYWASQTAALAGQASICAAAVRASSEPEKGEQAKIAEVNATTREPQLGTARRASSEQGLRHAVRFPTLLDGRYAPSQVRPVIRFNSYYSQALLLL